MLLSSCAHKQQSTSRRSILSTHNVQTIIKPKRVELPMIDVDNISPTLIKIQKTKISLQSSSKIPLQDAINNICQQINISCSIDSTIKTSIALHVKDRSVESILRELEDNSNIRWNVRHDVLHVTTDTPFLRKYHTGFLNMTTSISRTTSLNTSVSKQNSKSVSSGSNESINFKHVNDTWKETENEIKTILKSGNGDTKGFVSVSPQSGIILVQATQKQHKEIYDLLQDMKEHSSRRVHLKFAFVEFQSSDARQIGIDWGIFGNKAPTEYGAATTVNAGKARFNFLPSTMSNTALSSQFSHILDGFNITQAIKVLQNKGITRVSSEPSIMLDNGHMGQIVSAIEEPVIDLQVSKQTNATQSSAAGVINNVSVTSKVHNVSIGTIIDVLPVINDNDTITLVLSPSITRSVGQKEDPSIAYMSDNKIKNYIPRIKADRVTATFTMQNGSTTALVGLGSKAYIKGSSGVPILSDVPLMGNFFKSQDDSTVIVHSFVFVQASIINDDSNLISDTQKLVYDEFVSHDNVSVDA